MNTHESKVLYSLAAATSMYARYISTSHIAWIYILFSNVQASIRFFSLLGVFFCALNLFRDSKKLIVH